MMTDMGRSCAALTGNRRFSLTELINPDQRAVLTVFKLGIAGRGRLIPQRHLACLMA
jgi:hypothetical protein